MPRGTRCNNDKLEGCPSLTIGHLDHLHCEAHVAANRCCILLRARTFEEAPADGVKHHQRSPNIRPQSLRLAKYCGVQVLSSAHVAVFLVLKNLTTPTSSTLVLTRTRLRPFLPVETIAPRRDQPTCDTFRVAMLSLTKSCDMGRRI